MKKIAQEGYPFIIFFALITFFPLGLLLLMFYFFRDPQRTPPCNKDVFIAPADGKVIFADEVIEDKYLKTRTKKISIFMSVFDVHVNRAPCDGKVTMVHYNKGRFFSAYKDKASLQNENIEMIMEGDFGKILVRQVAGLVARRVVCRAQTGQILACGERFGIIKFSSRVDLYLPQTCSLIAKAGNKVRAGETIIARLD
jgi:phosphatidylserine decarboxylase